MVSDFSVKQNKKSEDVAANSGAVSTDNRSLIKQDEDAYEQRLCKCIAVKYEFVGLDWADEEIVLGTVAKYLKEGKEAGYDTFTLEADNKKMLLNMSIKQHE